jgi:hypothetical protein
VPNVEANQVGKRLAEICTSCKRDGVNATNQREIQDTCLMLAGLAQGRAELGMEPAEHQEFEELLDGVFKASNQPEATQGKDSAGSNNKKADAESPSKARVKRKIRSGEAPGSAGADKKKSRKDDVDISIPKLTSPYPPKAATPVATTGNSSTTTTSTATTATTSSTNMGASASHSGSTDSPPVSPRRGFGISAPNSSTSEGGDSASLLGRIATNLSTFANQFDTLIGFGHTIDRSEWNSIQDAQIIVKSLLEAAGQPTSQLGRANELDKLSRAISALATALKSAMENAVNVKHRDFDKAGFQKHAKKMSQLLESIQSKVTGLRSATEQPMPPRSASGASSADAVSRVRSSSPGAKPHPSLSTFGRKGGRSMLQSANVVSPLSPKADAPNSPRAARRSMLISAPVPHHAMNVAVASTTVQLAYAAGPSLPNPASAPLSPPTSPRALLKPQPQPSRLRPSTALQANSGGLNPSVAQLKTALGNYSMRNLMQGFAVEGNTVVPTGPVSSKATVVSPTVSAMSELAVPGNSGGNPAELRALLSGPSARNLLQRFRIDVGNVVANDNAPADATTSLPTQASGELSDADIAELVKKVDEGDTGLLTRMIESLEEVVEDSVAEAMDDVDDVMSAQSIEDTVILSSSSDEEKSVHDNDGTAST